LKYDSFKNKTNRANGYKVYGALYVRSIYTNWGHYNYQDYNTVKKFKLIISILGSAYENLAILTGSVNKNRSNDRIALLGVLKF